MSLVNAKLAKYQSIDVEQDVFSFLHFLHFVQCSFLGQTRANLFFHIHTLNDDKDVKSPCNITISRAYITGKLHDLGVDYSLVTSYLDELFVSPRLR